MSIYATLWNLKFPKHGEYHTGCEWIEVTAQGVPQHIGSSTAGSGYEDGDPYADFLPPAVATEEGGEATHMRAVVIVTEDTPKGTSRHSQEYVAPLFTFNGEQYSKMPFAELHERICTALRGDRPRMTMQITRPDRPTRVLFEDGTARDIPPHER